MALKRFLIILYFYFVFIHSSTATIIDIVFTVKNLASNEHLKSNFITMIHSLFEHTDINQLHLHIIGDSASQLFVNHILNKLNYDQQIDQLDVNELILNHQQLISSLIEHFSSQHTYYKDPLFFLSPLMHRILSKNISRVIMLDIDIRVDSDIRELYNLFDQFNDSQILGIARENQPVYRHLLWTYRQQNPNTLVGEPPPHGLSGFNSGVLLLDLDKMRTSSVFNNYLDNSSTLLQQLIEKYSFKQSHLGDQDLYTLLSFEHSQLFYILPCYWNRQLCSWWKDKGYENVWKDYFNCNNEQNIRLYHGNCNTPIPNRLMTEKIEL